MLKRYTIHRHLANWLPLFILLISLSLWGSGCRTQAQTPDLYRVGILAGAGPFLEIAEGFKAGMASAGYGGNML